MLSTPLQSAGLARLDWPEASVHSGRAIQPAQPPLAVGSRSALPQRAIWPPADLELMGSHLPVGQHRLAGGGGPGALVALHRQARGQLRRPAVKACQHWQGGGLCRQLRPQVIQAGAVGGGARGQLLDLGQVAGAEVRRRAAALLGRR